MTALRPAPQRPPARLSTAIGAFVVAMVASGTAHATPSAKLVYVRGTDATACPDETSLRRAVATRIGYDPFFPTASKTVIAQVSRGRTGYRGKVQIVGDDGLIRGERELATRGDDCSELISAMALAVSIALDDLDDGLLAPAEGPTPAETPKPADTTPTPTPPMSGPPLGASDAVTSTPAGASMPVRAAPSRLGIAASVGPALSIGAAPAPSLGASVATTVRYAWAAARFDLRADLPAGNDLAGGGSISTTAVLATGTLCVRGDVPFVCGGAGVGSFAATTASIAHPANDHALLVEVLAVGGGDVEISRQVFVEPFAEIGLVLTRHRIIVDGSEAYRLPAVAGTAGIHLGWRFL